MIRQKEVNALFHLYRWSEQYGIGLFRGHGLRIIKTKLCNFWQTNWYANRPSMPHPEMETLENFDKGFSKSRSGLPQYGKTSQ